MSHLHDGRGGVDYYHDEVGGEGDILLEIDDHADIQVGLSEACKVNCFADIISTSRSETGGSAWHHMETISQQVVRFFVSCGTWMPS
jgi:hypothetical protein